MKLLIKTFSAIMAISAMMISTSCSEENDKLKMTDVSLSIDIDIDLPEFTMEEGSFTLRNVNSGIETTVALDNSSTTVIEGLYNITFIGTGSYMSNGVSTEIKSKELCKTHLLHQQQATCRFRHSSKMPRRDLS